MRASLPSIVAQWIAREVFHKPPGGELEQRLQHNNGGLHCLLVKDLRLLLAAMSRLQSVSQSPHGPPAFRNRKKGDLVLLALRYIFFDLPSCQFANMAFCEEVAAILASRPQGQRPLPPPDPLNDTSHFPDPFAFRDQQGYSQQLNHQQQQQQIPFNLQQFFQQHTNMLGMLQNGGGSSGAGPLPMTNQHVQQWSLPQQQFNVPSLQQQFNVPSQQLTGHKRARDNSGNVTTNVASSQGVHVKSEAYAEESLICCNPFEQGMLNVHQPAGFTKAEILSTVRDLRKQSVNLPTEDQVMLKMITQRQEADEAKKMDVARMLSEQTRKEESLKRRKQAEAAHEETLWAADWTHWCDTAFCGSWLLQGPAHEQLRELAKVRSSKLVLLDLLKLELKARKWYQEALTRSYFTIVSDRLLEVDSNILVQTLQKEVATLQECMFTLSEQQGGVPRIFVQAHDQLLSSGGNGVAASSDNDDDVVVVVTPTSLSPAASASPAVRPQGTAPKVIEIL